jgi:ribosomal protein L32
MPPGVYRLRRLVRVRPPDYALSVTHPSSAEPEIVCRHCGQPVPDMPFCIRCGEHLHDTTGGAGSRRRGSFAGAPGESVRRVAPFSTLLPQLPHADLDAFRLAFTAGCVALLVLVAIGAYPVALVGAAVLVPALVLLYVYSVDVYEDTPLTGIAATMLWGAVWGAIFGLATAVIAGNGARFGGSHLRDDILLGVIVPLAGGAVMVIGPLFLMRDRKFNDVVDGATFGVASAVSFVGAQVIAGSLDLFTSGGLTPVGAALPWIVRIVAVAIAQPIVAAGVIGSVVGAFWLRYRAPIRDRSALGAVGRPGVAIVLGAVLLVASALATFLPGQVSGVVVQSAIAAISLVWLRRTLHLGLLEEAYEIEVGDVITCADCGKLTRRHTFCGNCGIALHALPKARPERASRRTEA